MIDMLTMVATIDVELLLMMYGAYSTYQTTRSFFGKR